MASSARSAGGSDPKGLYKTLGAPVTADEAEIRKAYRRLALRWHPDKNPDNPEATTEFQKISGAYEVLSNSERREMYDRTGCIDEEELLDSGGLGHAEDLFAAFFGGGFGNMDMDGEEQAMLDEFLRIAGGGAFQRKRRTRAKKGRNGKATSTGARSSRPARAAEEQMMGELFAGMMGGMGGMGGMDGLGEEAPVAACPEGHPLKRTKADAAFECDVCEAPIAEGKKMMYCKKCDFSVCLKCHKKAEAEAMEQEQEEEYGELIAAFTEAHVQPVRRGRSLHFRCELCGKVLESQDDAFAHMEEFHGDEIEKLLQEGMGGDEFPPGFGPEMFAAGGFGGGGFEELLLAGGLDELLGGGPGGPPSRAGGSGPRRAKKKR